MDKKLPAKKETIEEENEDGGEQTTASDIEGLLEIIKDKLNKLKSKLGFDNILSEHSKYMSLKEQMNRSKSRLSIDDELSNNMLGEIESLLGRIEDFELMSPDEVKQIKKYENPISILGRQFRLEGYKGYFKVGVYIAAGWVGYKYLISPYFFPLAKKILTTKVKSKRGYDTLKDADYTIT